MVPNGGEAAGASREHTQGQNAGSCALNVATNGKWEPYGYNDREREQSHLNSSRGAPLQVRVVVQLPNGTVREWKDFAQLQALPQILREVYTTTPDQGRSSAGSLSPLKFFWIDMSGMPQREDLSALFELLHVCKHTERRWRAMAAAPPGVGLGGFPLNNGTCEEGAERSHYDEDGYYDDATELDYLRAFVAEQYVQISLTVLESPNVTVYGLPMEKDTEREMGTEKHQRQREGSRPNLLDACESGTLASVQVLCFVNGVVTWRPQPAVEGWEYIPHGLERRLSNSTNIGDGRAVGDGNEEPRGALTTSLLVLTILDELYMAFLPDTTIVLSEVDTIDSMLPLVRQRMSDQADILRRIQMLRRSLSVHRRVLMSKVSVLELLSRPTVRVLLPFMNPITDAVNEKEREHCREPFDPRVYQPRHRHGELHYEQSEARARRAPSSGQQSDTYADIACRILHVLSKLEDARRILTNSIIIHSSGVAAVNNYNSNQSDTLSITLGYVALMSLPPTIVASQWGMNVYVPWVDMNSTAPFWGIVGAVTAYAALVLSYPIFCWIRGRPDKLVF
ncbi:CorA-like Mg2+ transporter protein [Trypanosoma brucei equiperdum]|uniref:CorA-like Mg2+ transporter protein n=1 Tax=Trypanosoma brucei equiperdum TaxID=630700 RepID=A0A3L6LAQ4_9TRYP|nr:CorA-like Mg2+ transporter protein [Trypanosoma brucei equiperdum]